MVDSIDDSRRAIVQYVDGDGVGRDIAVTVGQHDIKIVKNAFRCSRGRAVRMIGRVVGQRIAVTVNTRRQCDGKRAISADNDAASGDVDAVDDQAGNAVVASRDSDGAGRGFGSASRRRAIGQRRFIDLRIAGKQRWRGILAKVEQ